MPAFVIRTNCQVSMLTWIERSVITAAEHTEEMNSTWWKCLLSEFQCQCLATVSQTNLTLSHSLQCQTTNDFILSSQLNRWLTSWFPQWLMLVTIAWQWQRVTKQLLCLSVRLYFCLNVSTSNSSQSPTAAFKLLKSMPHRYENIIWGQFSLTKSIKSVNLYHTQWCSQTSKTKSLSAASLCSCVIAAVALQKWKS